MSPPLGYPLWGGALEIHAPTMPIRHRGDLLKGPVVTISAHAPMPDVIGVTFTHFEGEQPRGPHFDVHSEVRGSGDVPGKAQRGPDVLRRRARDPHLRRALRPGRPHRSLARRLPRARPHPHQQRPQGHGHHARRDRRPLPPRTARTPRGHVRLRTWRALRPARQERPGRRHVERRRRHRHRAGLQEHPLLPHRRGLRRLRRPPGPGLLRGRLGGGVPGAIQRGEPAVDVLRHLRPHAEGHPPQVLRPHRPPRAPARLVVRAVAVDVVHHVVRRGDGDVVHRGHAGA